MDPETWLYRAEEDWKCVRAIFSAPEKTWTVATFHCHQAAEKCLKAFLSFKIKDVPRIHDLTTLLAQALRFDPSLISLKADCEYLTDFAIDSRYPELDNEYDEHLAAKTKEAAERICTAVRERL